MNTTEIEARWLKIDPAALKQRLATLGAVDEGLYCSDGKKRKFTPFNLATSRSG